MQEVKRAIVRRFAQDIRTPLNTMVGCLGCLMQELQRLTSTLNLKIPPTIFDLVIECGESCNLARDVTSNMMTFEKIAAGAKNLELEVVPILEFVYMAARPFIYQARAKNVVMTVDAYGVNPSTCVKIDPAKMAKVPIPFFRPSLLPSFLLSLPSSLSRLLSMPPP